MDPPTLGSRAPEEPQDCKRVTASPPEPVLQGRDAPACLSSSLGVSRLKDKTSLKFLIVQTKRLLRLKAAHSDELSLKLNPHASHQCGPPDKVSGGSGGPLTIGTRQGTAGIHLLLTVKAGEARRAAAGVPSLGVVGAPAPIEAGAIGTHHGTQLADPAVEAGWAGAGVAVLKVLSNGEDKESFPSRSQGPTRSASNQGSRLTQSVSNQGSQLDGRAGGGWTHRAAPSVPARPGAALVHLRLTVGPRVPRPARARVAPLARVGAGGPVPAGLVVRAVVEVCKGGDGERRRDAGDVLACDRAQAGRLRGQKLTLVAEKAPPAFLAVALPGLLAGAVETAWVPNALVAVPALPAHSAP